MSSPASHPVPNLRAASASSPRGGTLAQLQQIRLGLFHSNNAARPPSAASTGAASPGGSLQAAESRPSLQCTAFNVVPARRK
jgi:hypothetical protein